MKRVVGVAVAVLLSLGSVGVAHADESPSPSVTPSVTPTETPTPTPTETSTPTPTPTPTPKPAVAAWSITLDQPAASWEDKPTVFTGKISQPITGSYITLWQRVPGAWVLRASTRTTTGGVYKFNYVSASTGTWAFRTMIGVKAETALAISDYRTVPIQDRKILINTPASWYATLTGVSVIGKMVPAEPGKELALQEYLGSGVWRLVNIATMDAGGNFRLRVPDDLPKTRTVRVVTRYVAQPAMEYSGLATIVIKAALNPKVYAVSAAMVPNTYRAGCPVAPASLRLLQLNYWGFDGHVHRGELILRDAAVAKMITVWTTTFASKFPIRQMRRVDVFGGVLMEDCGRMLNAFFAARRSESR